MILTKRSVIDLYSQNFDFYSHQVRIVLKEKEVNVNIIDVSDTAQNNISDCIKNINNYPVLVDRELILYNSSIILEYLDERFPHPPLLSVYPIERAQSRIIIYRIAHDWYSLANSILNKNDKYARKKLRKSFIDAISLFNQKKYFLTNEYSLIDCYLAPLIWRLPDLKLDLPKNIEKYINNYSSKIFNRESFLKSFTAKEEEFYNINDKKKY